MIVQKSQWYLVAAAAVAVFLLFKFGRTQALKGETPAVAPMAAGSVKIKAADFKDVLLHAKDSLSSSLQLRISNIENSVTRGNVADQQLKSYQSLARIWDSLGQEGIAAHYLGEVAKLENSEKSMTFAANLFLDAAQRTEDAPTQAWEAQEANDLLTKASAMDPSNDTIQVALATSEVTEGQIMQGVQRLLSVTKHDPNNEDANVMLGRLAVTSGQYDKAVTRLSAVVAKHPNNTEAMYFLAEAYRGLGDKQHAIEWFEKCKKAVNNPDFSAQIDQYINALK